MDQTLGRLKELGLIAVVRGESREAAVEVSNALIEGGIKAVEITFTTPEAPQVLRDLKEEHGGCVLVGAGTVTTREQADQASEAGASFLVSPGCDPDLVSAMLRTGLLTLPGVLTPSEVMLAGHLGMGAVKLFPGSIGGPSYLKALRGPFPGTDFLPTGGVSTKNVRDWLAAGAFAVGVGGSLAPPSLEGWNRAEVVGGARKFAEVVRAAKGMRGA